MNEPHPTALQLLERQCEVHGVSTIAASGAAYEQNFVMVVEAPTGASCVTANIGARSWPWPW